MNYDTCIQEHVTGVCVHSTCCVSVVHSTASQASSGSGQSSETGEGDTAQHGGQLVNP